MVIVDDTGTIRLVNAQTEALFGYGREELLGRTVDLPAPDRFRATTPRTGPDTRDRQVRPMGAGLELHGLRKDGTEFPVEISLSPLETTDGLLVSAAVRDVSDRKAAEERINELAALVEVLPGRDPRQDPRGAHHLLERRRPAPLRVHTRPGHGPPRVPAGPARPRPRDRPPDGPVAQRERVEHFETLRVTRHGDLLDVDITLWPTRSPDGEVIGACAIVRDISDRKRAEAELTVLYQTSGTSP